RRPYEYLLESSGYLADIRLGLRVLASGRMAGPERVEYGAALMQDLKEVEQTLQALRSKEGQQLLTPKGKDLVQQHSTRLTGLKGAVQQYRRGMSSLLQDLNEL